MPVQKQRRKRGVVLTSVGLNNRCRLVPLVGMGGIAKMALSVKLAKRIQDSFEFVIWRSLRNAPPLTEFLANAIEFLSKGQETNLPENIGDRLSRLIDYFRSSRCLLVLAVKLWDIATGQCLKTLQGFGDGGWSVTFSPDGQTLAIGSYRIVSLWYVVTGQCLKSLPGHSDLVFSVAFSPDV